MSNSTLATLLVACPDRKGLVAALSQLLFDHGANILQSQQHTEPVEKMFFQRIRFDLSELDLPRDSLEDLLRSECTRFDMRWSIHYDRTLQRVAIFVSKFEHCLYDLLLRHRLGELHCEISLIVSNHPDLSSVAEQFDVPYHVFPISQETKREQEARQLELLEQEGINLVVLARYMQILSESFVERFPQRIINIHHSTLPAFVGARPYHQAYERGVKLVGATAHYATADLDDGPIIAQDVVPCSHRDTVADLVRKGRDVERMVLASAVRCHLENRIIAHGRRAVVF